MYRCKQLSTVPLSRGSEASCHGKVVKLVKPANCRQIWNNSSKCVVEAYSSRMRYQWRHVPCPEAGAAPWTWAWRSVCQWKSFSS